VVYVGEGNIVTLRVSDGDQYYDDEYNHTKASSFQLHSSIYPGTTWYKRGLIGNVN